MKLPPTLRAALYPLSLLYGAAARSRIKARRKRARRLGGVVISVGNLTAGGTGKTPFVLWLAESLRARGKNVGILSRGYKSSVRLDAQSVQPAQGAVRARVAGDEPRMLSARLMESVRIGVGADRYAHGLALEKLGVEWFILDDGFQHTQLARDVDIVLIDASRSCPDEPLLPAGLRREPFEGLARADLILITRSTSSADLEAWLRKFTPAPVAYAQTHLRRMCQYAEQRRPSPDWSGKRLYAFCAIGNPEAFYADLRLWGAEIAGCMTFPDHHHFKSRDLDKVQAAARAHGCAGLICTEKDTFNLPARVTLNLPLYFSEIDMRPVDEPGFWSAVADILRKKKPEGAL